MLTDPKRGPFTIETAWNPPSLPLIWTGNAPADTWSWRLIDAKGACHESGSGYTNEGTARRAAAAVRDNEAA